MSACATFLFLPTVFSHTRRRKKGEASSYSAGMVSTHGFCMAPLLHLDVASAIFKLVTDLPFFFGDTPTSTSAGILHLGFILPWLHLGLCQVAHFLEVAEDGKSGGLPYSTTRSR